MDYLYELGEVIWYEPYVLVQCKWSQWYLGDIIHFRVFNEHTLILNSLDDTIELFEKQSKVYSDRPVVPIVDM